MSDSPGGRNLPADTAVQIHVGPPAGVTHRSGLTVYDEALVDGRFVGRYWSATGTIKPQRHLNESKSVFDLLPAEAFCLRIEDQALDRDWRWVGAEEIPTGQAGGRHGAVELAQQQFPVSVKIHTCFDGSPFLMRWLEITNGMDWPVSLAQVAPFAGLIWWLRDYAECVAPGSPVFALGFYEGGSRYRVTFDNSGEAVELSGLELQRDGLEIRLESPLTSELLLIERVEEA